jgi:FAD/FMN-containing dehydrogenase
MSKEQLIKSFQSILRPEQVISGDGLQERYHHIWRMDEPLKAICLLLPESTEEVSSILKICHDAGVPLVTHGGLTNLVGSTETQGNEVVISVERLNEILELDKASMTMTVQAGCILENVQNAAEEVGLYFPVNYGARGSAQIGGAIATNAGGLRVIRHGMMRDQILGLETVLADGTVLTSLKKIVKDNSGYDLKQLFVGSEGTLGIITTTVLKLIQSLKSRCAAYLSLKNYKQVVEVLNRAKVELAGKLTGFEIIWGETYKAMTSASDAVRPPLPYGSKFYVLIEVMGQNQELDAEELSNFIENILLKELIQDAVISHSSSDVDWFFRIREDVNNLTDPMDYDQHFDISIPIASIGDYVSGTIEKLKEIPEVDQVYAFGHVADGNIHFMIGKQNDSIQLKKQIDEVVYPPLKELNGSVSAEHGIGTHKKDYLDISKSAAEIAAMKSIKQALDPKGILNPGKIF